VPPVTPPRSVGGVGEPGRRVRYTRNHSSGKVEHKILGEGEDEGEAEDVLDDHTQAYKLHNEATEECVDCSLVWEEEKHVDHVVTAPPNLVILFLKRAMPGDQTARAASFSSSPSTMWLCPQKVF